MKPIRIIMNAFGPYRERTEIDFLKLENKNLFLITGSTGSGKSTIFDAITFALYGKGNLEGKGYEKETKSFKSDFATLEEECFVEYTFEIKGKEYYIRRAPSQEVKKLRGEGLREKSEEVILKYRDNNGKQVIKEKINEVRESIEDIIGLTVEQFRQIMIIPQGQFRKVISSDTRERKEILQKLFDISICSKVQEYLKEVTKEKEREIKSCEVFIEEKFKNIENEVEEEISEKDINKRIKFFQSVIDKNNLDIASKVRSIHKVDKRIYELRSQKGQAEILNSLIDNKEILEKEIEILESKKEEIDRKEDEVKLAEKAYKIKIKEDKYIEKEEELRSLSINISKLKESLNNEENKLKNIEDEIEKSHFERKEKDRIISENEYLRENKEKALFIDELIRSYIELLNKKIYYERNKIIKEKELEDIKKEISNKEKLEFEKKKIEEESLYYRNYIADNEYKNNIINRIDEDFVYANNTSKEIIRIDKDYLKIIDKLKFEKENEVKLKHNIEKMKSLFEENIILDIRKKLEKGKPCPVCGSKIHSVDRIEIRANHIKSDEIKRLEKEYDNINIYVNSLEIEKEKIRLFKENKLERYNKIKEKIKIESEQIGINLEKVNTLSEAKGIFLSKAGQIMYKLKNAKNSLKRLEEKREEIVSYIDLIDKREKEKEDKEKNILKIKEKELEKRKEILKVQSEIIALKERLFKKEELDLKFIEDEIFLGKEIIKQETEIPILNIYLKKLRRSEEIERRLINKFKELDEKEKNISENLNNLKGEIKSYLDRIKILNEIKEKLKHEFKESISEHEFNSIEDYKKHYREENLLTDIKSEIENYKKKYYTDLKLLEEKKKEIGNREKININIILKEIENLEVENKFNYKVKNSLEIKNKVLEDNIKDILNKYKENEVLILEYQKLKDLSSVSNRNNIKNMSFESYVLSTYLDEILEFTNYRFIKMTDGRYEIYRKENIGSRNSESGLELEVYDNYSNKRRDIKTLSGGESFKASLAMALGLSDVVKMYSGGIGIDTIFIDEGFGTLSPDSLDSAIDALIEIQNQGRLVGVISHVEALKERIPEKIEIISGSKGSKVIAFEK